MHLPFVWLGQTFTNVEACPHFLVVTGQAADYATHALQGDEAIGGRGLQRQVYTVELLVAMDYSVYRMYVLLNKD